MNWLFWVLAAWHVLGAVLTVAIVGKPRDPVSPGVAVLTVVVCAIVLLLMVVGWPT